MADSFGPLPIRQNKTSFQRRNPNDQINFTILPNHRPFTTIIGRTQNAYRNLENLQEELNHTFGSDTNNYVAENIRKLTNKFNRKMMDDNFSPNSTILSNSSNIKSHSQPRNIRQMKICGLVNPVVCKVQNVLEEPFVINAKEKLARMVARSVDKQNQYQSLQYRVKEVEKERMTIRRQKDRLFQNPEHVCNSDWEIEWRTKSKMEVARYRTRLSVKHKKINSNLTILW